MSLVVLHSAERKSRKDRRCDSCYRIISKGETYLSQDNVYDGNRYGYNACEQCRVVTSWVYRTQDTGWFDEGLDLGEWLSDCRNDSLTIARLNVYFRRKWLRNDGTLVNPRSLVTTPEPVKEVPADAQ